MPRNAKTFAIMFGRLRRREHGVCWQHPVRGAASPIET
jgi:hypothetical protein